jgi:hypothetical protein
MYQLIAEVLAKNTKNNHNKGNLLKTTNQLKQSKAD